MTLWRDAKRASGFERHSHQNNSQFFGPRYLNELYKTYPAQGHEQCGTHHNTCFGSYTAHTDAKPTDALGGQTGRARTENAHGSTRTA